MNTLAHIAEILRDTLRSVEQNTMLGPDDPAILELKRILTSRIEVLEAAAACGPHLIPPPLGHKPTYGPD